MTSEYRRNPRIEAAPLSDEVILFDAQGNRFFRLNRTGSALWHALDRPRTAQGLAEDLSQKFAGVDLSSALRDVQNTLTELQSLGLVSLESAPS